MRMIYTLVLAGMAASSMAQAQLPGVFTLPSDATTYPPTPAHQLALLREQREQELKKYIDACITGRVLLANAQPVLLASAKTCACHTWAADTIPESRKALQEVDPNEKLGISNSQIKGICFAAYLEGGRSLSAAAAALVAMKVEGDGRNPHRVNPY